MTNLTVIPGGSSDGASDDFDIEILETSYLDEFCIDDLRVETPCTADWNEMLGDDRARFCGQCEKNVYDLSALTSVEITDLIVTTEGKFCGRIFRRHDGTVLTADCPVGVAARAKRAARWAWASGTFLVLTLAAGALSIFSNSLGQACDSYRDTRVMGMMEMQPPGGIIAPPPRVHELKGDVVMGEPSVPHQQKLMGKIAAPRKLPVVSGEMLGNIE